MARSVGSFNLILSSRRKTELVGKTIGQVLQRGDVVTLIGDLGAGKTTLVHGIVTGLGAPSTSVASPTFVLMHHYQGRLALIHMDLYRLRTSEEAELIGLSECFTEDDATVIEWADRFPSLLPVDQLEVRLAHRTFTTRTVQFIPRGERSHLLLTRIKRAMRHHRKRTRSSQPRLRTKRKASQR